jgi:hypothetical protein
MSRGLGAFSRARSVSGIQMRAAGWIPDSLGACVIDV